MTARKVKKWDIVRVRWADAVTFSDPQDSDNPDLHKSVVRYTTGHLLFWNKRRGITVAMEDDREAGTEGDTQTVTHIGAGMIISVTLMREAEVIFDRTPRLKKISKIPLDNQD